MGAGRGRSRNDEHGAVGDRAAPDHAADLQSLLQHLRPNAVPNSPGIILHSVGDAFGVLLLWFYWKYGTIGNRLLGFAAASRSPIFWLYVAGLIVFTAASVWAFRKLAKVGTMSGK